MEQIKSIHPEVLDSDSKWFLGARAYLFLNKEPNEGVDHKYSQERWFEAYLFSIKPIYGSNMWKKQPNQPLLLPIVKRMPGKPRKNRVKAKFENNSQEPIPKPPQMKKHSGRQREPNYSSYASNKGGGRGSRGGRDEVKQILKEVNQVVEEAGLEGEAVEVVGVEGEVVEVKGDEVKQILKEVNQVVEEAGLEGEAVEVVGVEGEDEIRSSMEHEYKEQLLIEEEEKRIAAKKAMQEEFDKDAVRLTLEEEA
nr:zinc finger, PMZ-type [Tanacetum cinerariifolium]